MLAFAFPVPFVLERRWLTSIDHLSQAQAMALDMLTEENKTKYCILVMMSISKHRAVSTDWPENMQ